MWSTTVGQVPLGIDSWLLSGFSLQHGQSSPLFDAVHDDETAPATQLSKTALDDWCLWNHLCLVHLHYCVGTRRRCMLHGSQIARCRAVVGSDHATNYELRMVAEIYLYWTVYQNTSGGSIDLLKAIAHLQDWKKEWQFVLGMHITTNPPIQNQNQPSPNSTQHSATTRAIPPHGFPLRAPAALRPKPEDQNRARPRIHTLRTDPPLDPYHPAGHRHNGRPNPPSQRSHLPHHHLRCDHHLPLAERLHGPAGSGA